MIAPPFLFAANVGLALALLFQDAAVVRRGLVVVRAGTTSLPGLDPPTGLTEAIAFQINSWATPTSGHVLELLVRQRFLERPILGLAVWKLLEINHNRTSFSRLVPAWAPALQPAYAPNPDRTTRFERTARDAERTTFANANRHGAIRAARVPLSVRFAGAVVRSARYCGHPETSLW